MFGFSILSYLLIFVLNDSFLLKMVGLGRGGVFVFLGFGILRLTIICLRFGARRNLGLTILFISKKYFDSIVGICFNMKEPQDII